MPIQPEYQKVLETATFAGVIGVAVSIAKYVITKNHASWISFTFELTAALLVAILVGWLLDNTAFSLITKSGIIGAAAFIARDLLEILRRIKELIMNDPLGTIKEIFNMIRGK